MDAHAGGWKISQRWEGEGGSSCRGLEKCAGGGRGRVDTHTGRGAAEISRGEGMQMQGLEKYRMRLNIVALCVVLK